MAAPETAQLVVEQRNDADGLLVRRLHWYADGSLAVEGHDIGAGVERFFGNSEYEFWRRYSPDEARSILESVDLPGLEPLTEISQHFASTHALEEHAKALGIEGAFWSRVGD